MPYSFNSAIDAANTAINAAIGFFTRNALGRQIEQNKLPDCIEEVNKELIQQEIAENPKFLKTQIALIIKLIELIQRAENRDEEVQKRILALQAKDNQELGRMYLQTLEKQTQQEFQLRQQELQAQYDQRNWAAVFSRAELQKIFSKSSSLLMIVSKPNMSVDLFPDLAMSLGNRLSIFIGQYFPESDELCSVQFYSDFFDRAVSKAQLTQLQTELPTPTASIYTDITSREVFFNVRLQGIDEALTETLQAWNWRDYKKILVTEKGFSEEEALEAVEEVIIKVHKVLAGFLADWYYLHVNPHHFPRLLSPELEKKLPNQWLFPCVQVLIEAKKQLLQLLNERQTQAAAEKARKRQSEREQHLQEKMQIDRLKYKKAIPVTFVTKKAGRQEVFKVYERVIKADGIELVMVYVPAGEFLMGSFRGDFDEKPVRKVRIEKPFYMGKFPVTQEQWKRVMGNNPACFSRLTHLPVEQVSWHKAIEFCEKLSRLTEKPFRLPSEAEWEYACRAGTRTKYWWGDDMDDSRCWYDENSGKKTHPVNECGDAHRNPFGLCDMLGNVWEWCEDNWEGNYNVPRKQKAYKNQLDKHLDRYIIRGVIRGGSCYHLPQFLRSANRDFYDVLTHRDELIGLRVVYTA